VSAQVLSPDDLAERLTRSLALLKLAPTPATLARLEDSARDAIAWVHQVQDSLEARGETDVRLAEVERDLREVRDALWLMRQRVERGAR
jgi:hypothetical protein